MIICVVSDGRYQGRDRRRTETSLVMRSVDYHNADNGSSLGVRNANRCPNRPALSRERTRGACAPQTSSSTITTGSLGFLKQMAAMPHHVSIASRPSDSMFLTHLSCTSCGLHHDWTKLQNLCTACRKPLLAVYDLEQAGRALRRKELSTRAEKSLWRYRELLPVPIETAPVSLSEGGTPLLRAGTFGASLQMQDLRIKDESQNPTQSFKARGMSVAVSMAKHLGASKLVTPSAGNAASALAAYAARTGLEAHVFMPRDTPRANIIECRELGARVTLIDGLITDCAAEIGRRKENWFDVSTLKEPYRIEGKKTLGYELAEQLNWELPDVIIYPTGGGTGLIGMWKAFDEMEKLGWIGQ